MEDHRESNNTPESPPPAETAARDGESSASNTTSETNTTTAPGRDDEGGGGEGMQEPYHQHQQIQHHQHPHHPGHHVTLINDSPSAASSAASPASNAAVLDSGTVPRRPTIKKEKKKGDGKKGQKTNKFLLKRELSGLAVRGDHLQRLVQTTKLHRQQILNLSKKFSEFAPSGYMDLAEFKKALDFDKDKEDPFANRLFSIFSNGSTEDALSMDDFIEGVAKLAPDADIDGKLNLCYDMFDTDKNGKVFLHEFREMTKYSMRHGRFGIDDEKLNRLIDSQWRQLDLSADNEVSREEFTTVLRTQQTFVNSLTLQVPWLQEALRDKDIGSKSSRDYLPTEPLHLVLTDVALQFNATEADVKKWTDELHKNLYTDVRSLGEISSEDWSFMKLPRRLYRAIMYAIDPNRQSSADKLEGRVKSNIAGTGTRERLKIYIEFHKPLMFFIALYIAGTAAMLAWTCVKYLTDHIGEKYHDQYKVLGHSFIISRCAGALIKYNFAIFLFPVCYRLLTWMRTSKLEWIFPIDAAMHFHRAIGVWILLLGLIHMAAHCVNIYRLSHGNVEEVNGAFGFSGTSPPSQASIHRTRTGITGWIMVGCMLILVAFAMEKVRRKNFKLFFNVHHLYIPIVLCLVIHDGLFSAVEIVYWMIPVLAVFLFERALTIYRSVPKVRSLESTRILKGDVLALKIQKPEWFKYSAGHYLWINCPQVSKTEWHPFTLTSSPDEDFLMVDINCTGDWTKKLLKLYSAHFSSTSDVATEKGPEVEFSDLKKDGHHAKSVEVMMPLEGQVLPMLRVDGPYGTASSDVLLYTHVVLIGGGIGVTPFISILKSIRYAVLYTNNCPLHAVHFIWVTRNQENFQWFSQMLAELQQHEDLRGFLRVSIYLTGPRHPINDIRLLGVSLLMNKAKEELNEDLVTGLEGQTHFGRPDFSKILLQHNRDWSGNDVGVFFCGPPPLAHAVRVTCRALNRANQLSGKKKSKGARFHFKKEHF